MNASPRSARDAVEPARRDRHRPVLMVPDGGEAVGIAEALGRAGRRPGGHFVPAVGRAGRHASRQLERPDGIPARPPPPCSPEPNPAGSPWHHLPRSHYLRDRACADHDAPPVAGTGACRGRTPGVVVKSVRAGPHLGPAV